MIGVSNTLSPNAIISWEVPSSPLLDFFFSDLITLLTAFSVTVFNPNWRFLLASLALSLVRGSSTDAESIDSFSFTILLTKKEFSSSATLASPVIVSLLFSSFHVCSVLGLEMSLTIFQNSVSLFGYETLQRKALLTLTAFLL